MYLEKLRNKLRLWYWVIWLTIAFVLGIAGATIWEDIPSWKLIASMVIPIVLSSIGINAYWNHQFIEAIQLLIPVLERDPDQFIADFEELTCGKHVRKMVAGTYYNNMGTAYARKKCYREALSYYDKVNTKKLRSPEAKAVYWGNVALMHFYLKETDKALTIWEEKQAVFQRFPLGKECKLSPDLPLLVAHLEIRRLLTLGELEQAENRLNQLKEYAVKPSALDICAELEEQLVQKQNAHL